MNSRIKELREALQMTLEDFGARIGVTRSAISNIENGRRSPTNQLISSICREFRVNENWIRTGKGDMFPQMSRAEEIAYYSDILLSESPKSFRSIMVAYIMNLDAQDLEAIAGIIRKHGFPGSQPPQDNTEKQEEPAP